MTPNRFSDRINLPEDTDLVRFKAEYPFRLYRIYPDGTRKLLARGATRGVCEATRRALGGGDTLVIE